MRFTHRFDTEGMNELKTKISNSKWTPTVVAVLATALVLRASRNNATVIINNY